MKGVVNTYNCIIDDGLAYNCLVVYSVLSGAGASHSTRDCFY